MLKTRDERKVGERAWGGSSGSKDPRNGEDEILTPRPRSLGLLLVQCPLLPRAVWPRSNSSALVVYTENKTKKAIHHSFQQLVSFLTLKEKLGNHKAEGFFYFIFIYFLLSVKIN